jgi:hypothetical protein
MSWTERSHILTRQRHARRSSWIRITRMLIGDISERGRTGRWSRNSSKISKTRLESWNTSNARRRRNTKTLWSIFRLDSVLQR